MSDINLNFVVEPFNTIVTVEETNINFTPNVLGLNIFTGAAAIAAGGGNTEVQYNNNGVVAGSPYFTYNNTSNTVALINFLANGNVTLGNVDNVHISGGSANYALLTDGAGNLSWGTTNASPGGSNTNIQFNDSGAFGGNANLAFNKTNSTLTITGNIVVSNLSTTENFTVNALSNLKSSMEAVAITTVLAANYNYDILTQSIVYATSNANANVSLNFRANSSVTANSIIAVGRSTTQTVVITTGATAYGVSNVKIDGSAQTIKWVSGVTPTNIANSIQTYTFTLIKTASTPTYTVLGSYTRYA
jgi:hypothetical protein